MNYTKYSASGNDFVIFHTFIKKDYSKLAIKLCDRFDGIGADGLIALVPHSKYDFEWLFYNSDGSTASMCGNGTRATAHYAYTHGLIDDSANISFLTGAGVINCQIDSDDDSVVQTQLTPYIQKDIVKEYGVKWLFVDTGVPHLTALVDDLEFFDLEMCSKLRHKYNTNVNIAKIVDNKIYIRTYERGVEDETLACGTGMASAFLYAYQNNLVQTQAFVYPKSGQELTLSIIDDTLYFKGSVKRVFSTDL
jgi:diaminopimelate epimerase